MGCGRGWELWGWGEERVLGGPSGFMIDCKRAYGDFARIVGCAAMIVAWGLLVCCESLWFPWAFRDVMMANAYLTWEVSCYGEIKDLSLTQPKQQTLAWIYRFHLMDWPETQHEIMG